MKISTEMEKLDLHKMTKALEKAMNEELKRQGLHLKGGSGSSRKTKSTLYFHRYLWTDFGKK